jgi:hypothetical protein
VQNYHSYPDPDPFTEKFRMPGFESSPNKVLPAILALVFCPARAIPSRHYRCQADIGEFFFLNIAESISFLPFIQYLILVISINYFSMKNFTLSKVLNLSLCLAVIALLMMSSCSSPQHFSFRPAPPAFIKQKPQVTSSAPTSAIAPQADAGTFTASTGATPVALPEVAALTAKAPQATEAAVAAKAGTSQQKLTLAQKVVLKKLQKQATKLEQKTRKTLDTTAGPVSNRSAIALILIGLVIAIFGALLGSLFYTLGTLLILIGLVLLILNYI